MEERYCGGGYCGGGVLWRRGWERTKIQVLGWVTKGVPTTISTCPMCTVVHIIAILFLEYLIMSLIVSLLGEYSSMAEVG